MKQVLLQGGNAVIAEVPAPQCVAGAVLARVQHSCISAGTEVAGLQATAAPLWKRAWQQPERIRQTLELTRTQGVEATRRLVQRKVTQRLQTGYSAAGQIIAVGDGIEDLSVGQCVACAGNQHALHAEIICVPRNLCVRVPDGVDTAAASTVTLGAIALQGVRRMNPTLGETIVVVGLGILGQLTVQILRANGCKVIGIDLDPARVDLALALGMDGAAAPDIAAMESVQRLIGCYGADGVIITAATPSNDVLSQAFQMCRRKGRVVLVGDVGLHMKREDI